MSTENAGDMSVEETLASVIKSSDSAIFQFLRIYSAPDGKSRFQELPFKEALVNDAALFRRKALEVELLAFPKGLKMPYHRTDWSEDIPMKPGQSVLMIMLRGLCTLICDTEGSEPGVSYYPWGPGTVVLAEDTTGRGHAGWITGGSDAVILCALLGPPGTSNT